MLYLIDNSTPEYVGEEVMVKDTSSGTDSISKEQRIEIIDKSEN